MRFTAALLLCLAPLASAQAHHSFAMFDKTRTATVAGVIRTYQFTNPHIWIWLTVPGTGPQAGVYGFESGGPSQFDRMGIPRNVFTPGDKVTISYHPLTDGRKGGQFVSATLANGQTFDIMQHVRAFAHGN